ncbi:MAG: C40 family peptidase [Bacteroidetes bacterium]|nr:C40 family peptidase [Bacteroidota bacterium]
MNNHCLIKFVNYLLINQSKAYFWKMRINTCHLKLILLLFIGSLILSSCRTTKTTSQSVNNKPEKEIKVKKEKETEKHNVETSGVKNQKEVEKASKEAEKALRAKYSELLSVSEKEIKNIKLYEFIEDWKDTPYKYGGKSKTGVDCSNFATLMYDEVFKLGISGSCSNLYQLCKPIDKSELKEGDLLFFKIDKDRISHVGVYLHNNKFVHATTKKGVMINDLDETYYKKYFFNAARFNK